MTEAELRKYIELYVDDTYFDRENLIKYLGMHQMVGNEIFQYCDKRTWTMNGKPYSVWLDAYGYNPLYKDSFIQRIPFYFYHWDGSYEKNCGTLHDLFQECLGEDVKNPDALEDFYQDLIYMFYEKNIPLYELFNYTVMQSGQMNSGLFPIWVDYLHLCDKFGIQELMPERLITEFNILLEKDGKEPLIYEVINDIRDNVFIRRNMILEFEGVFPCKNDGSPIMKWIGISAYDVKKVWCNCEKSESGCLYIEIKPTSRIDALGVYDAPGSEMKWYRVYTGPLAMEFDYTSLSHYRSEMKLTQKQVAEAIGANVRTYQKWESGETTPDGQNLIRLMNWLNISDVQDVIKYT